MYPTGTCGTNLRLCWDMLILFETGLRLEKLKKVGVESVKWQKSANFG